MRHASAVRNPGARSSAAFDADPTKAPAAKRRPAGTMSTTLSVASTAVPTTKPSCTMVVSQPDRDALRSHNVRYCADTALAANQSDIPSSSAHASNTSMRQRDGCVSTDDAADRAALGAPESGAPVPGASEFGETMRDETRYPAAPPQSQRRRTGSTPFAAWRVLHVCRNLPRMKTPTST